MQQKNTTSWFPLRSISSSIFVKSEILCLINRLIPQLNQILSKMEIQCCFKSVQRRDVMVCDCQVNSASIKTRESSGIKTFNGVHEKNKTHGNVLQISFTNTVVEYIPKGLSVFFPSLVYLSIKDCGLKSILRSDLNGLEKLKEIYVTSNQLELLPNDLFQGMTALKDIKITSNKLEFISSEIMKPLVANQLENIYFANYDSLTIANFYPSKGDSQEMRKQFMREIDEKFKKPPTVTENVGVHSDDEDDKHNFEELWKTKRFSDFLITAGNQKKFPVHRVVVGVQSSVFAALFEGKKACRQTSMQILEFSHETVEAMLSWMYTGKISEDARIVELFKISTKFGVETLKKRCEKKMLRNLDEMKVLDLLDVATVYKSAKIKEVLLGEVKKMFPDFGFDDTFINRPAAVKKLIEAKRAHKRKIQEADDELKAIVENFKKQKT